MPISSLMQQRKRTRGRWQGGNAVLEMALVLLPLMTISVGIIDVSMPMFIRSLFIHAVREGTRYGITYRTEPGMTHSESMRYTVQQNAAGFLAGTAGLARIQVKFYSPTTFTEQTGSNANKGGNIVEIKIINYTWSWIAPLWGNVGPLTVSAVSADRLEVLPRNVSRPAP